MFHAFKMKLYIAFELDWLDSFMNFSQQKCVLCSGPWALLGCAMQGVGDGVGHGACLRGVGSLSCHLLLLAAQ